MSLPTFPLERPSLWEPPGEHGPPKPLKKVLLRDSGREAWIVDRYDDARAVLADVTFSSDSTRPDYPPVALAASQRTPGLFISMDPPEHSRFRRVLAGAFTAPAAQQLHSALRSEVDRLLAAMATSGSSADIISSVAEPLPAFAISELLGIPAEDRLTFRSLSTTMGSDEVSPARRAVATNSLHKYLAQLVRRRQIEPDNGLLSRLIHNDDGAASLTVEEVTGLAGLLLIAGYETTAHSIGLLTLSLLTEPGLVDDLSQNRESRQRFVTESLRYWTVVEQGVARVATKRRIVAGTEIQAGDAVIVYLPLANRDPDAFDQPGSFDPTSPRRPHLAFGMGMHRCLGRHIAALEMEIFLERLIETFPNLQLAQPTETLEARKDLLVHGLRRLDVTW